jgi:cytochrome c oxidase cbb3-type subunit 3
MKLRSAVPLLLCCAVLASCNRAKQVALQSQPPASEAPAVAAPAGEQSKMAVPPMPASSPQAVAAGKDLYVRMNCAGCHTYTGKGWMGPDLTDSYWRYGGTPDDIYRSIYEGRPQGMPAWGKALVPGEIWQLVFYIRSLPVHAGGDPTSVSPASGSGHMVDSLPPGPAGGAGK